MISTLKHRETEALANDNKAKFATKLKAKQIQEINVTTWFKNIRILYAKTKFDIMYRNWNMYLNGNISSITLLQAHCIAFK